MVAALEVRLRHRLSRLDLDVDFAVGEETLALVGPSGAGKSTILRAVAGLMHPQSGRVVSRSRVFLDTEQGVDIAPEDRHVGMVFQDGALFPFMSVLANVAYGVRADRRERERKALAVLERFGISALATARPDDLSGGERQRVALARAVASEPAILLLDEPLSAILVSHDFTEVVGLADRVAVLQDGRIVQSGTASELAGSPSSAFVASLAGVNYFVGTASRRENLTHVVGDGWGSPIQSTDDLEGPVGVVVYPWDVSLSARLTDGSALNALSGTVRRVSVMGNRARVTLNSSPAIVAEVTEQSVRHLGLAAGTPIVATWKATTTRLVRVRSHGEPAPSVDP
jgi:molybdate transport system ATP-binding protein